MNTLEVLESMNPVPDTRGNPGPPSHRSDESEVRRPPRRGRRPTLVGVAAACLLAIVAILAVAAWPSSAPVDLGIAAEATSESDPADSESTGESTAGSAGQADASSTDADDTDPPPAQRITVAASTELAPAGLVELPGNGAEIGRLEIPSVDLDVVLLEGVDAATLGRGPGHYPGTPFPGQPGNSVLAVHSPSADPLERLDEVSLGDVLRAATIQGRFRYVVVGIETIDATNLSALSRTDDDRLTIVTSTTSGTERRLITATLDGDPAVTLPIDDLPRAIALSQAQQNVEPVQVVAVGDGFVGIAPGGPALLEHTTAPIAYELVRSEDGTTWEPFEGFATIRAIGVAIGSKGDALHIVGTRAGGASGGTELFHTWTNDITVENPTWETASTIGDEAMNQVYVGRPSIGPEGAIFTTHSFPAIDTDGALVASGIDPDSLCELTTYPSTGRISGRVCGTTQGVTVTADPAVAIDDPPQISLVLAKSNGSFATVDPPWPDVPHPFVQTFETSTGYGVTSEVFDPAAQSSDVLTFESSDGVTWAATEEPDYPIGGMRAERDGELVYRSRQPSPLNDALDRPAMVFVDASGSVSSIDIREAYPPSYEAPLFFVALEVGEAGWALIAQRPARLGDFPRVERSNGEAKMSDFELHGDGYTLAGSAPVGPAELRDDEGTVLRSWEVLEMARPDRSGAIVRDGAIVIPLAGEEAAFPIADWKAALDPRGNFHFDVLFSPNGTDWKLIQSETGSLSVAIGTDRLAISRFHGFEFATTPSTEIIVVGSG
ncbi:MAG: class D sortase [Actinomycetota bacterium]